MIRWIGLSVLAILLAISVIPAVAQDQKAPPSALVSIYNVAPGKHLDFLKWMAAREAISKEAGVPATVWYAHTDGDSWDYVAIGPKVTDEQDKKIEELTKKKGLTTGFKASLEFRTFVNSHSDTFAIGPISASDMVKWAE